MQHAQPVLLVCLLTLGCSQPEPAAPPPQSAEPATLSTGAEQPASPPGAPAAKVAPESLAGLWVEFWALAGRTETQRYALFEDGRFGWRASSGVQGVVQRWGRWSADGPALVLHVEGEQRASDCKAADCQVRHDPPSEERLQLGECPPNDEAKGLDATYRCVSIAGQAFWRRGQADDTTAYFPQ